MIIKVYSRCEGHLYTTGLTLLILLFTITGYCYANVLKTSESESDRWSESVLNAVSSGEMGVNKALLILAPSGNVKAIRELIKKGADLTAKNKFGSTPLDLAVSSNNYNVVKLFLELGQKPTADNLMTASANGYLKTVELLLQFGANPNERTGCGTTALMSATAYPDIFKTLIYHNANVYAKDTYDRTVLFWAGLHGSPEVVKLLCRLGVNLQQKDKDGNTALSEAKRKGRAEIIKILENCK